MKYLPRFPHPLTALLGIFVALTLCYSLATPLFEAPDEVWHYAYVRWLAEGHGLPALHNNASGANQEVAQPPLYYATAALLSAPFDDSDLDALFWHNPGFGYQAPADWPDNKNMLIHTEREAFPWRGAVAAVRAARLTSLLFGVLAVLATWGLTWETLHDRRAALWAAALVACLPQFAFLSGVVSNDTAAAALAAAALWSAAHILRVGPRRASVALAGALVGLAALTKVSAVALLPLIAAALLWEGYARTRRPLANLRPLLLFLLVALSVGGWWYARNGLLYHDPLALHQHTDTLWGRAEPATLTTLLRELPLVYRSFWAAFGWGHVQYAPWVYTALGLLPLAALWGWARRGLTRRWPAQWAGVLIATLWCGAIAAALLQWMRMVEAPHGRLLLPAVGAWALLMVGGWRGLPKAGRYAARGLLGGLLTLAWLAPLLVIRPAFAPPRLQPPAEAAATVAGPALDFDGRIRLLGTSVENASAAPGDWVAVRACWEALAPSAEDDTVFVQFIGADTSRVGERSTYPGLGRFPTSRWPVGRAFCDTYRVRVEPWAPTPELYAVVVGLYGAEPEDRLPITDQDGNPIGLPVVGQLHIAPENPPAVAAAYPLDYRLGQAIRLRGYDITPLQSGRPLTLTLIWEAVAPPQTEYTVFVHLTDAAGLSVAQGDGPPRAGRYPTSAWQAGDVIRDAHVLRLPALAPGQSLRLDVGLYNPLTGERAPVIGPEGPVPDNSIPLPLQP